jgi:nucleotide-binding universal stress UspA family protein
MLELCEKAAQQLNEGGKMPGIIVGMDNSAHAHQALDWAMREAGMRQVALTVMSVIPAMASPWTGHPLTVPDADEAIQHAKQAVEEAVAKAASSITGPQPPSVSVNVFAGFPAQALVDAAHDAELVVVGSRGAGGFTTTLVGSVSDPVAHHATCPVVMVPSGR